MILVADSGSTKTTWAEVATGASYTTEGLNPHFSTDEQVLEACALVRQYFEIPNTDLHVFFYGAGCGDPQQSCRMKSLLQNCFNTDTVQVETDLTGACRAVSDSRPSLVGILGTGSNACYYDGQAIQCKSPSLGYILGDEGSANQLGRELLKAYFLDRTGDELKNSFQKTYHYSYTEWMDRIYHQPHANRFLASLATFVVEHKQFKECENLIWHVLDSWYSEQLSHLITRTHCCRLHVVGGFGKAIENQLREAMTRYELEVGTVLANPIDGLVHYHQSI